MRNRVTKSGKKMEALQVKQLSKVAICVASMCYGPLYSSMATANPTGENVVNGSASFDQQGSQLNITNSHGTIINWDEFSIAQNEAVKFLQDNANSAVLNRVVGQLPSDILGELSSNGKVFLINPNGLLIGNGARIDTSGFVGSTLDISNEDFVAGNMNFKGNGGSINNQGYIAAGRNGEVILIAPQIENSGIIEAQDGNILLAAGREVTLHSLDNPGIAFRVSSAGDKVLNLGQLLAENGSVKVFADQVVQQGTVSANRLKQNADGTIVLEADSDIEVSGNLSAKGQNNAKGGTIQVLGWTVKVKNATIDASGESGGEVLVGGDYQGNGTVKNARTTDVDAATVINADAGSIGDGGRVIVWSDDTTNTYGKITARGGSQSGDGGFVETSGKKTLDFGQPADVSAANGAAGTWLLDPEDIVIDEAKADSISSSLNGGSNVEVKTSDDGDGEGNITVAAAITKTEGDDAVSLTLDAHNRVDVNEPITSTAGPLNVNIKTGRTVANAEVEEPAQVPEVPNDAPDEMVASDEEPQVAEESDDSELDLIADDTDEGIDNQLADDAEEAQQASDDALAQVEEVVPEVEDTEIEAFIDEDVQQIVITEDIDTAGGSISIQAGEEGDVIISSSLTTSQNSDSEDQQAGDITIEAKRIAIVDDAEVDASGEDAGTILVGGDQQGQNDEVQNAEFVYVGEDAQIKADGAENGDGGKVIVFAEGSTTVEGMITAKGGTESGDGGFIETSGLRGLRVTKAPDASASNGKSGEWLIDPFYNIEIGSGTDASAGTAPSFLSVASSAFIDTATLIAGLVSNSVTVTTGFTAGLGQDGDISITSDIDFAGSGIPTTHDLTLNAADDIFIEASIYQSSAGNRLRNLNLNADTDNNGSGNVVFDDTNFTTSLSVDVSGDINIGSDTQDVIFQSTGGYGGIINADNDINIGTGTSASSRIDGDVTMDGTGLSGFTPIKVTSNNLAIYANDDISLTAGSGSSSETVFMTTNSQIVYADEITITGGGTSSPAGFLVSGASGSQMFNTTDDINLQAGTATGGEAEITTSAAGSSQTFQIRGHLNLTSTTSAAAKIKSQGTQSIETGFGNPGSTSIVLTGTAATDAVIESVGTQTIETNDGVLTIDHGTVKVTSSGSSVANVGDVSLGTSTIDLNGGTLNIGGNVVGPMFTGTGTKKFMSTTINNNSATATTLSGGILDLDVSTFNNGGTFNHTGGNLDVNTGSTFNNNGLYNWSAGNIDVDGGSTFNNAGTFNDSGSGALTGAPTTSFDNMGTYNKTAGTTSFNAIMDNMGGTVDVDSGATLNLASAPAGVDVYKQSSGTTTVDGTITTSGARTMNFTGGRLEGTGTIGGTTLTATNTTIAPGNSIGTLTVNGNLDLSGAGNVLEIEADSPTNHDVLNVGGSVTMAATNTLNVQLISGYTGPAVIGNTDTLANVITSGVSSLFTTPVTSGNADAGITTSYASTLNNFSVDLTRVSAPPVTSTEVTEEVVEEMTGGTTPEEMIPEPPAPTGETPDVVNIIVTITEEERKALVEAGLLEDDDDDDDDKKDKPKQMCVGV